MLQKKLYFKIKELDSGSAGTRAYGLTHASKL